MQLTVDDTSVYDLVTAAEALVIQSTDTFDGFANVTALLKVEGRST